MTRGAKTVWAWVNRQPPEWIGLSLGVLILATIGAGIKLPVVQKSLIAQPPKLNTNSYGCALAWDASPTADSYRVFLGSSPDTLQTVTIVAGTNATIRIWETNAQPWVGVTAIAAGIESDMSQLLTRTNYLHGWTEMGVPWQQVTNTTFDIQTTGTVGMVRMHGHLTDNWPKSP